MGTFRSGSNERLLVGPLRRMATLDPMADRPSMAHHTAPRAKAIVRLISACVFVVSTLAAGRVEGVSFDIHFNDAAGVGFNDPVTGAAARDALQFAADTWGSLLADSYAGETVTIDATLNFAGAALANTMIVDPELVPTVNPFFAFPVALANHLSGTDLNGAASEIRIEFNPNPQTLNGPTPWYFGTDGNTPAGQLDFTSTALHEIMHGLGMTSGMNGDGSTDFAIEIQGVTYATGWIYDTFVFDATSSAYPISLSGDPVALANLLATGDLRFNSVSATAANGGVAPQLFVPDPFRDGSSVIHLDPLAFGPGELMRPNLGVGSSVHTPSAVDLAILSDLGWNTAAIAPGIPEPSTVALFATGIAGFLLLRRRPDQG